jgi:serine/threonine protein kinase
VNRSSHHSEQPPPTVSDLAPLRGGLSINPLLRAETEVRAVLGGVPAITSWRPNAHLSAVERYGRFEILGRIGRGGMAEILLARERSFAGTLRHLVVKRMLPENVGSEEMLRMFLAEARVVMGLSHPNLCQIYEVGEQDGTWFIAMEWVNGVTLHQLIKRAYDLPDLDYPVLARVLAQCAEALHHAHTARDADGRPLRLVHRDVSPHNLMVAYDGRVKLLDFGIAKSTASTHHTETGIVKGKVCYMAPEQWRSEALDARTDVFALGACLFEVLTGQIAFRRETQSEVMRAICDEPSPRITDLVEGVPEELAEIVHRALAKDPAERFQNAFEMSEALERFVADHTEPVNSARIAEYARDLFPSEVALGPMLERAVRGADLERPMILPPLPGRLRGLSATLTATVDDLPSERPSLPRLLGTAPLPAPPAMPAPTEPVATPSRPPSRAEASFDDGTEVDHVLGHSFDSFTELDALPDAEERLPRRNSVRGPSAFSDAPTRPLKGLSGGTEIPVVGAARHAARTESMQVPLGTRRRVAIALLATALGAAVGVLAHDSLRSRVTPVQHLRSTQPVVLTARLPAEPATTAAPASPAAAAEVAPSVSPAPTGVAAVAPPVVEFPRPSEDAQAEAPTREGDAQPARSRSHASRPHGVEGLLSINSHPWSTVYLGSQGSGARGATRFAVLGTTPLANVAVPRGVLTLKLVDRDGHVHLRRLPRSKHLKRSAFFDFEKNRR